jgi:hypothetical protein
VAVVSTLAEIEAAADALSSEEKKKLLQFLESRVNGEPKRPTNLAEFAGSLRLSEDPLAWQRRVRGEWEHGAPGGRRVDGKPEA